MSQVSILYLKNFTIHMLETEFNWKKYVFFSLFDLKLLLVDKVIKTIKTYLSGRQ